VDKVYAMASLAKWMAANDVAVDGLTAGVVEQFTVDRRLAGYKSWCCVSRLSGLMGFLRQVGALPVEPEPSLVGVDALVAGFGDWIVVERHLGSGRVKRLLVWARQFADRTLTEVDGLVIGPVGVGDVESFIGWAASRRAASSMGDPIAALRYFLMYLAQVGLCDRALIGAVPKVKQVLRLGLPTALAPDAVAGVLTGCDDGSLTGMRNAALTALATDLGLRGAEIARLMLDDIDWAGATVMVAGKNGRREQMPLTSRAGAAVARWLVDGRRPVGTRHVFHTVLAPRRPMTGQAVVQAVWSAGVRAGIGGVTTRTARHSLGCAMVAGSGTMEDARQLLRHASAAATAIYARVDMAALAELAMPWPGVSS